MNETKKALECCVNAGNCVDCPLNRADIGAMCVKQNMINALDLINRYEADIERLQKAYIKEQECFSIQSLENERLKVECERLRNSGIRANSVEDWITFCNKLRVEAIKEFAERLVAIYENDKRYDRPHAHTLVITLFRNIDNLVKEMVGEDK